MNQGYDANKRNRYGCSNWRFQILTGHPVHPGFDDFSLASVRWVCTILWNFSTLQVESRFCPAVAVLLEPAGWQQHWDTWLRLTVRCQRRGGRGMLRIFLEEEATRNLSAPAWIGGAEVDWERCLACSRYKKLTIILVTRGMEKIWFYSLNWRIANLAEWPQNSMIAIYEDPFGQFWGKGWKGRCPSHTLATTTVTRFQPQMITNVLSPCTLLQVTASQGDCAVAWSLSDSGWTAANGVTWWCKQL